jgi:hypothetical protein
MQMQTMTMVPSKMHDSMSVRLDDELTDCQQRVHPMSASSAETSGMKKAAKAPSIKSPPVRRRSKASAHAKHIVTPTMMEAAPKRWSKHQTVGAPIVQVVERKSKARASMKKKSSPKPRPIQPKPKVPAAWLTPTRLLRTLAVTMAVSAFAMFDFESLFAMPPPEDDVPDVPVLALPAPEYVPLEGEIPIIEACDFLMMEPGTVITTENVKKAYQKARLKYQPDPEKDVELTVRYNALWAVTYASETMDWWSGKPSPDIYFTRQFHHHGVPCISKSPFTCE